MLCIYIMCLYEVGSVKLVSASGQSQLCSITFITGPDFSLFKAMQFLRLD